MEIWETIIMKLSKEKLQQIIKEEMAESDISYEDTVLEGGTIEDFVKNSMKHYDFDDVLKWLQTEPYIEKRDLLAYLKTDPSSFRPWMYDGQKVERISTEGLWELVAGHILDQSTAERAKELIKLLMIAIKYSGEAEIVGDVFDEIKNITNANREKFIKQTKSDEESGQMEESKIKLSKEELNQIVQEELQDLMEVDADIAAALMGRAGLPRSSQETKVDRPVTPQELGPEEELPQISQEDAIEAFIEAFIQFPQEKQNSWQQDEKRLSYVLNQFIRSYRMDAIEGSAEDLDNIWNALNESKLTKKVLQQFIEEAVSEAWKGDPEIEQTGQYSDKSTEELCAMKSKLMKKEKRTDAEQKKVRQINFAIRSKQKGPKFGKVDC